MFLLKSASSANAMTTRIMGLVIAFRDDTIHGEVLLSM